MEDHLHIEKATDDDYTEIVALLKDTDLPPDGIESNLADFLVVRAPDGSAILGCVGLEVYQDSALLRSLAVHPSAQRKGIGTHLVKEISQHARDLGISKLFLLTETAEKLFIKLGFTRVSRAEVPVNVLNSIEFTTLCTEAPAMMKSI